MRAPSSSNGKDITHAPIRERTQGGHEPYPGGPPQARPGAGLHLGGQSWCCSATWQPEFAEPRLHQRKTPSRNTPSALIKQYDVRSGQGPVTIARSMSGGNQQKAIIAREIDKDPDAADRRPAHPRPGRRRDRVHPQADRGRARHGQGRPSRQPGAGRGHATCQTASSLSMRAEIVGEFDPEDSHRGGTWACTWQAPKSKGSAMKKYRRTERNHNTNSALLQLPGRRRRSGKFCPSSSVWCWALWCCWWLNPGQCLLGGMKAMLTTGFSSMDKPGARCCMQAAPHDDVTGLSVGFAIQDGPVQHRRVRPVHHGLRSSPLLCAIQFQLPWFVCLLAGGRGRCDLGRLPGPVQGVLSTSTRSSPPSCSTGSACTSST